MISVLAPGAFSTIQDLGRFGLYDVGVPPGGPVDDWSFRIANILVGNEPGAAALEVAMVGPRLFFERDCLVAVTGGEGSVRVDGVEAPLWRPFVVPAGRELEMAPLHAGSYAYLSVNGGFDVPSEFGSRATLAAIGVGGFMGRQLREGDRLALGAAAWSRRMTSRDAAAYRWRLSSETTARVVMGPFDHLLTSAARRDFLDSAWSPSPRSNRVGLRLEGPTLAYGTRAAPAGAGSDPSNVVDAPYPVGGVQAPSGAELIVLLADAVTGGGYATFATTIAADRGLLAQSRPGQQVRFAAVSPKDARQARAERLRVLARLVAEL